jgi:preprotein translocase subunit SecG
MGILYGVLVGFHILFCLFLILVILLQSGKGAGLSGLFGSSGDNLFGGQGPDKIFSILTTICAILFVVTSISLSYLSRSSVTSSITDKPVSIPTQQSAPVSAPVQE